MTRSILLFCSALAVSMSTAYATDDRGTQEFTGMLLAQASTTQATTPENSRRYGPVRRKETLWGISLKYRGRDTTMSQLMMSIYENNRHAFVENNINRLEVGVMLDIPAESTIRATDHQAAYAEVITQIATYKVYVQELQLERRQQQQARVEVDTQATVAVDEIKETPVLQQETVDLAQVEAMKLALEQEQAQLEQAQLEESPPEPPPVVKPRPIKHAKRTKPERPLFRYSYGLAVVDDSNIRKAQNDVDIRSDVITSLTLNARGGKSLGRFSLLSFGGSLNYEAFNTFDTLNNLNFNLNAKYRFATSAGFTSPLYGLGIKLGGIDSESEMRDSTLASISVDMSKWLTNAIRMTTGLEHKQAESKSRVFDTVENRFFVNLDLNLSKAILFYTTYTFISGDIVSSASPTLAIINAADAIEPDDAFGSITTNQFAYRLDADTQLVTLGYNQILSQTMSIDLSARLVATEAADGIEYDRSILRASLLGRF